MVHHSAPTAAVILAAGMGTRLRALHSELPKGLLTIGGVSLVPRAIELLREHGVTDIMLVTGWKAEAYEHVIAEHFPDIRCVHNPDFATTGTMHSLFLTRGMVAGDFLLLESDLLFEPRALEELLAAPRGDYVLLSGTTGQGDEVFAYGDKGRLRALSKTVRPEEPSCGEFTGISRLTAEFFEHLCEHFAGRGAVAAGNYHYDDAFTALAPVHPVSLLTINDLVWCEIDDPNHHALALARVLPALEHLP
jgi:2-aminoethylphosphonate-pyruvate transaminase